MPGTAAGHLSVHVEGLHADDVPFLFERQAKRMGLSFAASAALESLMAILMMAVIRHATPPSAGPVALSSAPNIVWLVEQGEGGGGGGGGNQRQEPPRQAQLTGRDSLTVPATKPPNLDVIKESVEEPVQPLVIPAQLLAAVHNIQAGIIDPAPPSLSQGTGTEGGAGTGADKGVGTDVGSGLGPGRNAGNGGKEFGPGSGVTFPVEIYVPKPQYTADAMRARIQGTVWVECVVQPEGTCTNTRVVRSLDPTFGLDQEALRAARLFRFRPGMRMGEPVPVLITIELSFSLH